MNRPSYKELWLYEHKDRDEQLQWIRDAVDGEAEFCNRELPYSEEEELARQIMTMHTRIAELEAENERLQDAWFTDETICPDGSLRPKVSDLLKRIAELEAYIDQLIEIGGWAITGMTIATSYSPGKMQNLAEKKSDDWYALIKNLKECDKENEREE